MDEMHHWVKRTQALATLALENEVVEEDKEGLAAEDPPLLVNLGWWKEEIPLQQTRTPPVVVDLQPD